MMITKTQAPITCLSALCSTVTTTKSIYIMSRSSDFIASGNGHRQGIGGGTNSVNLYDLSLLPGIKDRYPCISKIGFVTRHQDKLTPQGDGSDE